jgi:hypothetical protein
MKVVPTPVEIERRKLRRLENRIIVRQRHDHIDVIKWVVRAQARPPLQCNSMRSFSLETERPSGASVNTTLGHPAAVERHGREFHRKRKGNQGKRKASLSSSMQEKSKRT